jgi:hypothetical protein
VYGCLTCAAKVSDAEADAYFRDLIDHVVSSSWLKDNIAYIRSTERDLSGCSNNANRLHFHFIAISHGFLSPGLISRWWSDAVGDCKVEPYDASKKGIGYILKMREHERCDWTFSDNLYLFQQGYTPLNKRQRRVFKRQAVRDAKRSSHFHKLALPVAAPIPPVDAFARSLTRNPSGITKTIEILHAIDQEIALLVNVRALLTGQPVPAKRGRALHAQSVAAQKPGNSAKRKTKR